MIPELGDDGHLPIGRYLADLDEVHARFVLAPGFEASTTRVDVWSGFMDYLFEWARLERWPYAAGIIRSVWIGGSFVSVEPDPEDIDISPLIDGQKLQAIRGRPGSGHVKTLIGDRGHLTRKYHVEAWPVTWWAAPSVFQLPADADQRDYLHRRGAMDDWWQRRRPPGPKGPPTPEDAPPRRGYLEVIV